MTEARFGQRDPDARGYYGEYGGKFVPETLVAPVEELQAGVPGGAQRLRVSGGARPAACALRGPAHRDLRNGPASRLAAEARLPGSF